MTDVDAVAGKIVEELGVTLATLTTARRSSRSGPVRRLRWPGSGAGPSR
jgi:hypothetical protein